MALVQVIDSAAPGSSALADARALERALDDVTDSFDLATSSIIFAAVDADQDDGVLSFATFEQVATPGDTVVVHASGDLTEIIEWLIHRGVCAAVYMDGLSYGDGLSGSEELFALNEGSADRILRDIVRAAAITTPFLTTSSSLADRIRAHGAESVFVVPPSLVESETVPRASTLEHFASLDTPIIYCPGPLLPHRNIDVLIEAYHIVTTYLVVGARMVMFGPQPSQSYRRLVETHINELNLTRVWMSSTAPPNDHEAFLRVADMAVSLAPFGDPVGEWLTLRDLGIPSVVVDVALRNELGAGQWLPLSRDDMRPSVVAEAMVETMKRCVHEGRDPSLSRASFPGRDVLRILSEVSVFWKRHL